MQTRTLFPMPKYRTDHEFSYKGHPAFIYSSRQGETGWAYLVVFNAGESPKAVVLSESELDSLNI